MDPVTFLLGGLSGLLVGLLLSGALFLRWRTKVFRGGGVPIRVPTVTPSTIHRSVELQPFLKALMHTGADRDELYIRSRSSVFLVRVLIRRYKTKPDVLVVEIRNSDENRASFDQVRTALEEREMPFDQRRTPKLQRPKDLRIRYESAPFAPAAVSHCLEVVFQGAGVEVASGVDVSPVAPTYWSQSDSAVSR